MSWVGNSAYQWTNRQWVLQTRKHWPWENLWYWDALETTETHNWSNWPRVRARAWGYNDGVILHAATNVSWGDIFESVNLVLAKELMDGFSGLPIIIIIDRVALFYVDEIMLVMFPSPQCFWSLVLLKKNPIKWHSSRNWVITFNWSDKCGQR